MLTLRFIGGWGGRVGVAGAQRGQGLDLYQPASRGQRALGPGCEQGHLVIAESASVLNGFDFSTFLHVGSLHSLLIGGT